MQKKKRDIQAVGKTAAILIAFIVTSHCTELQITKKNMTTMFVEKSVFNTGASLIAKRK
jgi:hypothetical protein